MFIAVIHFFGGVGFSAPSVDLRPPGYSGFHPVPGEITTDDVGKFIVQINGMGTGPHEGHAALQNIK